MFRVSFSLLNVNECRLHLLYHVRISLAAEIKCTQIWETAWQQD